MKTLVKLSILTAGIIVAGLPSLTAADATTAPAPATPAAPAHGPRGRMIRRAMMRHHLAAKLGLSADQKTQLKSLREQTVASVKAIRNDANLTADQKKAKVKETVANARTQMRTVLTPDQQTKMQELRAKLRKGRRA